jgi:hypothetical protein
LVPTPLLPLSTAGVCAGIVRLLRDLDKQARQQGGAVYMLNGNHESLNVCGDFRSACNCKRDNTHAATQM